MEVEVKSVWFGIAIGYFMGILMFGVLQLIRGDTAGDEMDAVCNHIAPGTEYNRLFSIIRDSIVCIPINYTFHENDTRTGKMIQLPQLPNGSYVIDVK